MITKNKIVALSLVSILAVASSANAGTLTGDVYLGISMNKSMSEDINIAGTGDWGKEGYSLALGWELPVPVLDVRAELEYNNMGDVDVPMDIEYESIMANAYFDIPFMIPLISPYVGFGAGKVIDGSVETSGGNHGLTDDGLSTQYMLGVDFNLPATPFYASLEYKKANVKIGNEVNSTKAELEQDIVSLKLRYLF